MKIEEVIENFDFVKVHKVMESLNWTWANNKKSKNKIPSIKRMKKRVRELYEDCKKGKVDCCSSGGYEVSIWKEDGEEIINVKFILEEF